MIKHLINKGKHGVGGLVKKNDRERKPFSVIFLSVGNVFCKILKTVLKRMQHFAHGFFSCKASPNTKITLIGRKFRLLFLDIFYLKFCAMQIASEIITKKTGRIDYFGTRFLSYFF